MKIEFGKAFSYIFDDPKWFDKVIIPILYGLIPIVGWLVVSGYVMRVTRNVASGWEQPLPVCDFGEDLALGFKYFVVGLVYGLIPAFLGWILAICGALMGTDLPNFMFVFAMVLIVLLMIAYAIFLMLVMPVVQANVAVKNSIAAGFEFKNIFGMLGKNISAWLLVVGGSILANMIAPIGFIAFGIGVIFTRMYAQLITANLEGQAYAVSQPEVEVIETVVATEAEAPAQEPTEARTEEAPTETSPDAPSGTPDVEA